LFTGGGTYNNYLMHCLSQLNDIDIHIPDKNIIEFKEALIFGLLWVLRLRSENNCLSSVTGARKNHSSAEIYYP